MTSDFGPHSLGTINVYWKILRTRFSDCTVGSTFDSKYCECLAASGVKLVHVIHVGSGDIVENDWTLAPVRITK